VATLFSDSTGEACVNAHPTVMTRNGTVLEGTTPSSNCQRASIQSLRVLYISKDRKSNILTSENLEQIKKIEDRILDTLELTKYCYLISSNFTAFASRDRQKVTDAVEAAVNASEFNHAACARINSVLNFMDELYFEADTGLGYHLLTPDLIPQEYDLSQEHVNSVANFWGNYTTTTYDLTNFPVAVGKSILLLPSRKKIAEK
jgi:hypothetical protein